MAGAVITAVAGVPFLHELAMKTTSMAFVGGIGDRIIVQRDYAIVGESEYSKSLNILLNMDEQLLLFEALGQAYHQTDTQKAIFYNKQAINLINDIRSSILSEKHRITFAKQKDGIFNRLISELMITQEIEEAFYYSENARSRAFVDLLASADIRLKTKQANNHVADIKRQQAYSNELRKQINVTDSQVDYLNKQIRSLKVSKINNNQAASDDLKADSNNSIKLLDLEEASSLVTVQTIDVGELKSYIAPDAMLMEWYMADNKLFVWGIMDDFNPLASLIRHSPSLGYDFNERSLPRKHVNPRRFDLTPNNNLLAIVFFHSHVHSRIDQVIFSK
jgi:hypothetical protein